jgi:hypothetical protein
MEASRYRVPDMKGLLSQEHDCSKIGQYGQEYSSGDDTQRPKAMSGRTFLFDGPWRRPGFRVLRDIC